MYRARRERLVAASGACSLFHFRAVITQDGLVHGCNFMEGIALPQCMRDTVMFCRPLSARDQLVESIALTGVTEALAWSCVYCVAGAQRDPWPR